MFSKMLAGGRFAGLRGMQFPVGVPNSPFSAMTFGFLVPKDLYFFNHLIEV